MSVRKAKRQTRHGLSRMNTRIGISNEEIAINTIRCASKKGMSISEFEEGALKDYLRTKDHGKRIKVYKGTIYIFNKTSDRVITLYPIPEEFMEEYNKYGKQ